MNMEITIVKRCCDFGHNFFKKQLFWPFFIRILAIATKKSGNPDHRRTRRGVRRGGRPPGFNIFRANFVFRTSASCSKILNYKKYMFNTVKIFRVNCVFQGKR